jgi:hypothetical protein
MERSSDMSDKVNDRASPKLLQSLNFDQESGRSPHAA